MGTAQVNVILNSCQDPLCPKSRKLLGKKWTLKQVQGDGIRPAAPSRQHLRATTAQRAVFGHLGQMPPAAATFVVAGAGDADRLAANRRNIGGDEKFCQLGGAKLSIRHGIGCDPDFCLQARADDLVAAERLDARLLA